MNTVEIGIGKTGRRAYGLDDIAIVPARRTRDPEDVSLAWEMAGYRFDIPVLASAMDVVVSPLTAVEMGFLGGLGVLNLEGLWTRYEDPRPLFDEITALDDDKATARMQEMYAEPIKAALWGYPLRRTTLAKWQAHFRWLERTIRGPTATSWPGSRPTRTVWTTSSGCAGLRASSAKAVGP